VSCFAVSSPESGVAIVSSSAICSKQAEKRDVGRAGTTCDLDKDVPEWVCHTDGAKIAEFREETHGA
jgi:hypothetical protein